MAGMGREVPDDDRELANRLFAKATAMLEDAIELAVAGQSPRLDPSRLAEQARRLLAAAHNIAILAQAAEIIAEISVEHRSNPRNRSR